MHVKRVHRDILLRDAEHQSTSASDSANQTFTLLTVNKDQSLEGSTGKMADAVPFL